MGDCRKHRVRGGDEIDLIEFAGTIWAERILILTLTAATTLVALAYSFAVPSQYASKAVISPATIETYGALAEALGARQRDSGTFGIKTGAQITYDIFNIYAVNLRSLGEQRAFLDAYKADGWAELSVSKQRVAFRPVGAANPDIAPDPVTVSAVASEAKVSKKAVEQYLAYTSVTTTVQINNYLSGLGISQRVEPGSLYRLEQPAKFNSTPVKPRRGLIIVLGFVLGGMFGIFVALIRITIRKRARG